MRQVSRVACVGMIAALVSGHIGSPDVFFVGRAGPYDVRVTIRPPQVVPGIARVTVRAPADAERVSIRPVYWRAGSKGAPSADETRRLDGQLGAGGTFEGSLWLMARGAYTVDVIVEGKRGKANVLVPIASVARGRLTLSPALGGLLAVLGFVLVAGLVTIVYKGAGEALVTTSAEFDATRRRRAQRVAAIAVPILALAIVGGARWWDAVDDDYERTLERPSPLDVRLQGNRLELKAAAPTFLPGGRVARLIPDHGKVMHLFLVRAGGAGFAHLHPSPVDTTANPGFVTPIPPLPEGRYQLFADVVHETGFERTMVGSLDVPASSAADGLADADDAWFAGEATNERVTRLADGSTLQLDVDPAGPISAGVERTLRLTVRDSKGQPAILQPYLGMSAHGVVVRDDGSVYVHLHPMGTVTKAAQDAFHARDRGDTTVAGRLRLGDSAHAQHQTTASNAGVAPVTEFPYAFPKGGSYRLFVQVKRDGRILTGAFALSVRDSSNTTR